LAVTIVADSATEISQDEAKKLNIEIVPLKSIFKEQVYLDGIDLLPEEFYQKLGEAKTLPTTSQPTPLEFEKVFRRIRERGDQVIVITIASAMSGTYQSATIARDVVGDDIWIIDSETSTLALQVLVRRAIELRDAGHTAQEIVQAIEKEKGEVRLFAAIDTLEYLQKGGRLSKTSAVMGTMLKVKPLVSVLHGEVKAVGKSRGMRKASEEIFQLVDQSGGIDFERPFLIGYTSDSDRFEDFAYTCAPHFQGREPLRARIGSVIGTHVGPGAIGIAYFCRNNECMNEEQ
jgi:DegV family protein with EDD domain